MNTIQWASGAAILFLGHEISFIFSGIMAGYLGTRLTHLLPSSLPSWAGLAFIATLAVIAAGVTMINREVGFYITGSLAGGFLATEYFAPLTATIPIIPFIIGAILVSLFIGILKDWGVIIVSCITGIYLIYGVLPFYGMTKTLASAGIFVLGALSQVIIFQTAKHSER